MPEQARGALIFQIYSRRMEDLRGVLALHPEEMTMMIIVAMMMVAHPMTRALLAEEKSEEKCAAGQSLDLPAGEKTGRSPDLPAGGKTRVLA